jgi:hypothetical protein
MKNQKNHARHHVGLIVALVGLMSGVALMPGSARLPSAQAAGSSWSFTGSLYTTRAYHTATLLPGGKILVAGGIAAYYGHVTADSAELYDQATGTWSNTGNLNAARSGHTATLLPNGKVLVAGGIDCFVKFQADHCSWVNSTELYDPATGTWSSTGNLNAAREYHTATLLPNGKVLVTGGYDGRFLNSAELYDPATGTWSYTGNLNTSRYRPTATLLPNGKVLVVGGYNLNSAELYDPATGIWTSTGNLNAAQSDQTATLLPNGKVLVAGGGDAELYDPATGTWAYTGNSGVGAATLLLNGKVLGVGGNTAELYDPTTGTWSITGSLNTARRGQTATLLPNGQVLVAGGVDDLGFPGHITNSAELYDPDTNIDEAQFFVQQQYFDFLDRAPDRDGLAYWTSRITECGSDARCIHERRIGVSAAFFIEQEFQDTGYYVYRFYKASFGRQPNYAEFTSDRSLSCDDCGSLEDRKQYFAYNWVEGGTFLQVYPSTMSNAEFVNKLFDTAGLTASIYDTERQQEIAAMNAGGDRAQVLRDVIEIPDFKNVPNPNDPRYSEIKQTSQYNPAFVLMQYFGYLHRDLDRDGYDFWLDVVNNREPNNYHAMVCAFITSREYQLRFGSVVTRSNADCSQ